MLEGAAWGPWRGAWTGEWWLAGGSDGWKLISRGAEEGRWPTLVDALATVWPARRHRGPEPWAIGWLSYEICAELEGDLLSHRDPGPMPQGLWLLEPTRAESAPDLAAGRPGANAEVWTSLSDSAFAVGVERILARIAAGDVYQVNLTRRFRVEPWEGGLAGLERAAAEGGAPPYLASFQADGSELVCASMELLLRRRGRSVATGPIKGTRPRGEDAQQDAALRAALDTDPKERAELAMVVDLERNDLGRVAVAGSVRVADPGSVVTFPNLHHRIALVEAEVPAELPWWEVLRVMAPGGSVTGCPKRAATAVIVEEEPVPRGPYTGVLGVVAGNGDMELALPIRTAWSVGRTLEFAAGSGIVWGSDPAAEAAESRLKVARWLALAEATWS